MEVSTASILGFIGGFAFCLLCRWVDEQLEIDDDDE
jgi:ammonia channel protein AmtB